MKKDLGYTSLAYFIFRATYLGISSLCIATLIKQDMWIGCILGIIFGLFPIYIFYKIASNDDELNILEKIDKIFPKAKTIIKILLGIAIYFLLLLNFYNLTNFIKSHFLNNTPTIVISISLIITIMYLVKQENRVFSRVAFILFIFSLLFFVTSVTGLINRVHISNVMPIMEYNPTKGIIPYISYNVLPIFMILIFPNKYIKKSIVKGYIIASISLFIEFFFLISILGIDLILLFQYPEFHTLKYVFEAILSVRLENFLALQWLFDIFIFTAVGFKYTNETFKIKKIYIIPILTVILNQYIFSNTTIANIAIIKYFPYIIPIFLFLIPLIIYIKQKKENKFPKKSV